MASKSFSCIEFSIKGSPFPKKVFVYLAVVSVYKV